jgi:hypothetical protein
MYTLSIIASIASIIAAVVSVIYAKSSQSSKNIVINEVKKLESLNVNTANRGNSNIRISGASISNTGGHGINMGN